MKGGMEEEGGREEEGGGRRREIAIECDCNAMQCDSNAMRLQCNAMRLQCHAIAMQRNAIAMQCDCNADSPILPPSSFPRPSAPSFLPVLPHSAEAVVADTGKHAIYQELVDALSPHSDMTELPKTDPEWAASLASVPGVKLPQIQALLKANGLSTSAKTTKQENICKILEHMRS